MGLFENDGGIRSKSLEAIGIATAVSENVLNRRAARGMQVRRRSGNSIEGGRRSGRGWRFGMARMFFGWPWGGGDGWGGTRESKAGGKVSVSGAVRGFASLGVQIFGNGRVGSGRDGMMGWRSAWLGLSWLERDRAGGVKRFSVTCMLGGYGDCKSESSPWAVSMGVTTEGE